ncbi:MAG: hypothetical protein ACTS42_00910 [Candidatus Hodgkinia cicadicola]
MNWFVFQTLTSDNSIDSYQTLLNLSIMRYAYISLTFVSLVTSKLWRQLP